MAAVEDYLAEIRELGKRTFCWWYVPVALIPLLTVWLTNRLLPSLLNKNELSTISALIDQSHNLGPILIPSELEGWPFWFLVVNFQSWFNPAYITAALFIGLLALLTYLMWLWHEKFSAAAIAVFAASASYSLFYAYGLKPSLIFFIQLVSGLVAATLLTRKISWGWILLPIAVFGGLYSGLLGIIMGLMLAALILWAKYKGLTPKVTKWDLVSLISISLLVVAPAIAVVIISESPSSTLSTYIPSNFNPLANVAELLRLLFIGDDTNVFSWHKTWQMFSISEIGLGLIGFIAIFRSRSALRNKVILSFGLLSLGAPILLGINSLTLTPLILISLLMILAGLRFLYRQWFAVYPKNTVAQTIAILLLLAVGLSTMTFHLTRQWNYLPQLPSFEQEYRYTG